MEKTQKLERIQLWKEYKLERDKTDKWRSISIALFCLLGLVSMLLVFSRITIRKMEIEKQITIQPTELIPEGYVQSK